MSILFKVLSQEKKEFVMPDDLSSPYFSYPIRRAVLWGFLVSGLGMLAAGVWYYAGVSWPKTDAVIRPFALPMEESSEDLDEEDAPIEDVVTPPQRAPQPAHIVLHMNAPAPTSHTETPDISTFLTNLPQDPDAALMATYKALETWSTSAPLWAQVGLLESQLGHPEKALQALQKAHELDASNPVYLYNLGIFFEKNGAPSRARPYYLQALRLTSPTDALHTKIRKRLL